MAEQHPITPPPPELVEQWIEQGVNRPPITDYMMWFATQAARWGADTELEACVEWLPSDLTIDGESLRDVRRPKPPSLKEQALAVLDDASDRLDAAHENLIRRALEQLDG